MSPLWWTRVNRHSGASSRHDEPMSPHRKPRTRVTVTAVDDHPIVVEGLASLMSRAPRADWLDGLVAATRENSPELVWLGQSKTLADLLQRLEEWETPRTWCSMTSSSTTAPTRRTGSPSWRRR